MTLATTRWGDGPVTVLMLHGIGGSRESFGDAVSGTGSALAEAGYRALACDLPGYGDSPAIEPFDMAGMAESVAALVGTLGDGPVVIVGHSMGGMVAQELVARALAPVHGLVLMATSAAFGKPGGEWQQQFLRDRLSLLDSGQGMAGLAPVLTRGMASPSADEAVIARAAALMSRVPEPTYRAALQAIVAFDRRTALGAIRMPVLCLAGEHDRNAPPAVMQQMALRIPGAEYLCLAGMGHLAHMEAPTPVHRALLSFLARHFPLPTD